MDDGGPGLPLEYSIEKRKRQRDENRTICQCAYCRYLRDSLKQSPKQEEGAEKMGTNVSLVSLVRKELDEEKVQGLKEGMKQLLREQDKLTELVAELRKQIKDLEAEYKRIVG